VVTHHEAPRQGAFETADQVRVAVLLTDSLGFAFVPPAQEHSLSEFQSLLPHQAQYCFDPDPQALAARITSGRILSTAGNFHRQRHGDTEKTTI
jgi:hypothetical protein